jgi:serine/threonine protein kinase
MSIKEIADILLNSMEPEDVFKGKTKEEIKKEYRNLAKICHPDLSKDEEKDLAEKTTILLNEFYELANKKLEEGIYNLKDIKEVYKRKKPLFDFEHRSREYKIYQNIKEEDVSTIYEGLVDDEIIRLKISNDEEDNLLLDNEFKILSELNHLGLPNVISKLKINGRTALIMKKEEGLTIQELKKEYGIIPEEHIFWILERLLSIVGFLHSNKIVHGNIKPDNIIIDVDNHNVKLIDYTLCIKNANETTSKYKIINDDYTPNYVDSNSKVIPNVDIYAIGKLAINLMGGEIKRDAMPINVSIELRRFVRKLLNKNSNDAWLLWDELIELRNKLYGTTRFQKLERKLK